MLSKAEGARGMDGVSEVWSKFIEDIEAFGELLSHCGD